MTANDAYFDHTRHRYKHNYNYIHCTEFPFSFWTGMSMNILEFIHTQTQSHTVHEEIYTYTGMETHT